jgi:hypothetical protein
LLFAENLGIKVRFKALQNAASLKPDPDKAYTSGPFRPPRSADLKRKEELEQTRA